MCSRFGRPVRRYILTSASDVAAGWRYAGRANLWHLSALRGVCLAPAASAAAAATVATDVPLAWAAGVGARAVAIDRGNLPI